MPLHVHAPHPLNLGIVRFSPIELIESGIAHPLVSTFVESNDLNVEVGALTELIVIAATGTHFDNATTIAQARNRQHAHALSGPWCEAINDLSLFLMELPKTVYQRFITEIREGRPDRALIVAQTFVNVVHNLAFDPISTALVAD